jgi:fatty acid desaturase
MAIRVNRVLSKKQNIAGIPADIFLPAIAFDTGAGVFLCLVFGFPFLPILFLCLIINIVWAILVARGVWRFLGTFYHPPRYYRQNIRYKPFLEELIDHDSRPRQKTEKRKLTTRKGQGKRRRS